MIKKSITTEVNLDVGEKDIILDGNIGYEIMLSDTGCRLILNRDLGLKEYVAGLLIVMHLSVYLENKKYGVTDNQVFRVFKASLSSILELATNKLANEHKD